MTEEAKVYPPPVKVAGVNETSLNFETAIWRKWGEVRISAADPVTRVVVWEMEVNAPQTNPSPDPSPASGEGEEEKNPTPSPSPLAGEGEKNATSLHKPPYVRGVAMSKLGAEVKAIRAYHAETMPQHLQRGLSGLSPYADFMAMAEYNRPPSGVADTQRINLLEQNRILMKKIETMQAHIDSEKKAAADRLKARDYAEPSEDEKESRRDARRKKAEEMGMDAKDFSTMEMIEKLRGQYGKKGYGGRDSRQTLPVAALLTQDYVKERILASQQAPTAPTAPTNAPLILEGVAKAVGE